MHQAIDVQAAFFIDRGQEGDFRTLLGLTDRRPGLTASLQVGLIHNHAPDMQLGNHIVQVIGIVVLLALSHNQLAQPLVQRHMRDIEISKLSVGHAIDQVHERIHLRRVIGRFDKGAWQTCRHCSLLARARQAGRAEMYQQAGQNHDRGQRCQGQRYKEAGPASSRSWSTRRGTLIQLSPGLAPGRQDYLRLFYIFRHKVSW